MKPSVATRQIHVRFFAILREQVGCSALNVETSAPDAAALYTELQGRIPTLSFSPTLLKVSINERYTGMSAPLNAGDRVVFIPPVAGG